MLASEPKSASWDSQLRICWMSAAPGMPSVVGVAPTSPSTQTRARSTDTSLVRQRDLRCAWEIRASSDPFRERFLEKPYANVVLRCTYLRRATPSRPYRPRACFTDRGDRRDHRFW